MKELLVITNGFIIGYKSCTNVLYNQLLGCQCLKTCQISKFQNPFINNLLILTAIDMMIKVML